MTVVFHPRVSFLQIYAFPCHIKRGEWRSCSVLENYSGIVSFLTAIEVI